MRSFLIDFLFDGFLSVSRGSIVIVLVISALLAPIWAHFESRLLTWSFATIAPLLVVASLTVLMGMAGSILIWEWLMLIWGVPGLVASCAVVLLCKNLGSDQLKW